MSVMNTSLGLLGKRINMAPRAHRPLSEQVCASSKFPEKG